MSFWPRRRTPPCFHQVPVKDLQNDRLLIDDPSFEDIREVINLLNSHPDEGGQFLQNHLSFCIRSNPRTQAPQKAISLPAPFSPAERHFPPHVDQPTAATLSDRLGVSTLSEFEKRYAQFDGLSQSQFNLAVPQTNRLALLEVLQQLRSITLRSTGGHESSKEGNYSIVGPAFEEYEKQSAPKFVKNPPNVEVDCSVKGLYKIDDKEQTFNVSFEVTFRWEDPSILYKYKENPEALKHLDFEDHFIPKITVLGMAADANFELGSPVLETATAASRDESTQKSVPVTGWVYMKVRIVP